jgi:hypothetical protein
LCQVSPFDSAKMHPRSDSLTQHRLLTCPPSIYYYTAVLFEIKKALLALCFMFIENQ